MISADLIVPACQPLKSGAKLQGAELSVRRRENSPVALKPRVVCIQPEGSRPPLFLLHTAGEEEEGPVADYRPLAQLLGPDQPSFLIQPPNEPGAQIERLAAGCVEEMIRVQPAGPYFLAGVGTGGIVAFEVGCQLQSRGREVALLALVGTVAPCASRRSARRPSVLGPAAGLRRWRRQCLSLLERVVRSIQERLHAFLSNCQSGTSSAHRQALLSYRPRTYPGRMVLFRARKLPFLSWDPALGWAGLAEEGVAVNVIPGTPQQILQQPGILILAAELKTCLIEAHSPAADVPLPETVPAAEDLERPVVTFSSPACSIIT